MKVTTTSLWRTRRSAVSVLFATAVIPIIGLCGLAVDYALWSQITSTLNKAVNVAALNATKIAVNGYLNADKNYLAEGQAAGLQWAVTAAYPLNSRLSLGTFKVNVSGTTTITANATYTGGQIRSIFGRIFGVGYYPTEVQATSIINTAPYVEVVMMIDNSSSMDIAATNTDIANLEQLSPCDPSNAFSGTTPNNASFSSSYWYNQSEQAADIYSCNNYHGVPTCPVPAPAGTLTTTYGIFVPDGATTPATYNGQVPTYASTNNPSNTHNQYCAKLPQIKQTNGTYVSPIAGAPCAFACHWTTQTNADGTTQDLFGLARRKGIQLRFDEVKNAALFTLQQMMNDNISSINNLSVGIYTFNTAVQQIYPNPQNCTRQSFGCEAGSDFTTAQTLVGAPPILPSVTDTGILPSVGQRTGNNYDTAWPEDANSLANNYVTAAGDGNTPTTPRKVLFLITDGFQDDPNTSARRAFDYDPYCTQFKNMNYQVYVVYTPYYPVMHTSYENAWTGIVEGSVNTPGTLAYNLQACSSQSSDLTGTYYISAQDQTTLNAALASFLKQALNNPARYTQ